MFIKYNDYCVCVYCLKFSIADYFLHPMADQILRKISFWLGYLVDGLQVGEYRKKERIGPSRKLWLWKDKA